MNLLKLWLLLLGFRVFNALTNKTFFQPDEYWQSLEVAHNLVYGYGHLTWEWQYGIRSIFHPLLFAIPYQLHYLSGSQSSYLVVCGKFGERNPYTVGASTKTVASMFRVNRGSVHVPICPLNFW